MRKNTISCFRTIRKNKDDLAKTSTRRNKDILNGVGKQYHIALPLTGMVPKHGRPTRRHESTALCNLFVIFSSAFDEGSKAPLDELKVWKDKNSDVL